MNKARIILLTVGVLVLGGCEVSPEDQAFYYSGWLHPQEGSNMRMYGTKTGPAEYGGRATTPVDASIAR